MTMELEFRSAQPDDAAEAIPLIYSSGPAVFDFVFADDKRGTAQEFLDFAFRDRAGEFGCGTHTIVTDNGRTVGAGACFSGETTLTFMTTAIRQIWSFYGPIRGFRVMKRGLQVERLIKPPGKSISCVAHLGVVAECQGHGIGSRLVDHFLVTAKQANHRKAVLDVSRKNPRAESLYLKLGFRTVKECVSSLPGVPDHRRMEIDL
jgi:ribosomal protein S18 acetylase RimI-like enzyme